MLTHTMRNIERRCADYTFSLSIVCTQARTRGVNRAEEERLKTMIGPESMLVGKEYQHFGAEPFYQQSIYLPMHLPEETISYH